MHIGSALLIIWLIIGAIAAGQRGYYNGTIGNCTKAGTIAVTIAARPAQLRRRQPENQLHRDRAAAQSLAAACSPHMTRSAEFL